MSGQISMAMPDLPDGWEYTGEFRIVREGEFYRDGKGFVSRWSVNAESSWAFAVIRRKYTPEPWLKPGWVYPWNDLWYWTKSKPGRVAENHHGMNWLGTHSSECLTKATNFASPPERRPYPVNQPEDAE